ncbi:MAG: GspH/FimT family pseudopilin [Pseudomonadota bacterium]
MRTEARGYSLYELVITVAIASIVVVLGVPSLGRFVASSRQVVEINALHHALHRARSESIMRRRYISLCSTIDGEQCSGSEDWSSGWLMFENSDRDRPARIDAGESILDRHTVSPTIVLQANRSDFTVRGTQRRSTNGTLIACDIADRAPPRALVVSYTGRPRAAQTDRAGEPYRCSD